MHTYSRLKRKHSITKTRTTPYTITIRIVFIFRWKKNVLSWAVCCARLTVTNEQKKILFIEFIRFYYGERSLSALRHTKTRMFDAHEIYRSKLAWTHTYQYFRMKVLTMLYPFVYVCIGSSIWLYQNHQFIFSFHSVRLIWLIYCQCRT